MTGAALVGMATSAIRAPYSGKGRSLCLAQCDQGEICGERRNDDIVLLGVPSLGLALATTAVTTYVPLIARTFTGSTTVIGLIIAIAGLLALALPLVFGAWL